MERSPDLVLSGIVPLTAGLLINAWEEGVAGWQCRFIDPLARLHLLLLKHSLGKQHVEVRLSCPIDVELTLELLEGPFPDRRSLDARVLRQLARKSRLSLKTR